MGELILPGAARPGDLGIVQCAADDCGSKGLARPSVGDAGEIVPLPPEGWGALGALSSQGDELVLFVCSQACQRRLAWKLNNPRLGDLDG